MNRQVVLAKTPAGIPQAGDFALRGAPVPELGNGNVLIENHFLSVEPAMRGWLADKSNYSKPILVGEVMRSLASGKVVASRNPHYVVGDWVTGWFGWQETAEVREQDILRKISESDLPPSLSLGILGLNGLAAYLGLTVAGQPRAGETVVVSTAAGAVGSAVGQIAKILAFAPMGWTHFSIIRLALFTMPFFGRSMWERGLLSAGPPHMRAGIPGTRDRGRSGISS
jgi:NADPH-dependent curcumin reductase CurA